MESTFKTITKILPMKKEQLQNYQFQFEGSPQFYIQKFIIASLTKSKSSQNTENINKFINYLSQYRNCKLVQDYFKNLQDIRFMACSQRRIYNFDPQQKAYCIYGKAVSAIRRKGKDGQNDRNGIVSQIQNVIFQLNQQNLMPIQKNQSHDIDDILLHFQGYEENCDPIYLSNQVFSPFVPQPFALVMVLPINHPKQDQLLNFLKATLLHIYTDFPYLLSKIIFKDSFYKNSILKGIYFIQEGQVQSTGGRIVARGWVTNGRCKSAGLGWKFKPLPFLKGIAKNQHIWKQFVNDLTLNKQYPININYILGLDDQLNFFKAQKKGGKKFFLPRIGHGSIDFAKLSEIEKVKHYDDRINEICDYKQKLLQKKTGISLYRPLAHIIGFEQKGNNKKMLLKHNSVSKSRLDSLSSSSQNILIMSVLKKLQNLTEQTSANIEQNKDRRDKIRISPAHLYEKARIMKKKRYNQ